MSDCKEPVCAVGQVKDGRGPTGLSRGFTDKPGASATRLELATVLSWSKRKEDLLQALVLLDSHLQAAPDDPKARLQRARVRSWVGQIETSAADYKRYLALHPNDHSIWRELAAALSWSSEKHHTQESLMFYDRLIKLYSDDPGLYLARARVRSNLRRYKAAGEDYDRYLHFRPKEDKVWLELATMLSWSKSARDRQRSMRLFDAYIKKHPDDNKSAVGSCTCPIVVREVPGFYRRLPQVHGSHQTYQSCGAFGIWNGARLGRSAPIGHPAA